MLYVNISFYIDSFEISQLTLNRTLRIKESLLKLSVTNSENMLMSCEEKHQKRANHFARLQGFSSVCSPNHDAFLLLDGNSQGSKVDSESAFTQNVFSKRVHELAKFDVISCPTAVLWTSAGLIRSTEIGRCFTDYKHYHYEILIQRIIVIF